MRRMAAILAGLALLFGQTPLLWAGDMTVTPIKRTVFGDMVVLIARVNFSASYAAGGDTIPLASLGMAKVDYIQTLGVSALGNAVVVVGSSLSSVTSGPKIMSLAPGGQTATFTGTPFTPTGTVAQPTFTVTKGAILANTELGLSADATTATVNNNTIAATRILSTNSPVGAPGFTGDPVTPAGTVAISGMGATEVSGDQSLDSVVVMAY